MKEFIREHITKDKTTRALAAVITMLFLAICWAVYLYKTHVPLPPLKKTHVDGHTYLYDDRTGIIHAQSCECYKVEK